MCLSIYMHVCVCVCVCVYVFIHLFPSSFGTHIIFVLLLIYTYLKLYFLSFSFAFLESYSHWPSCSYFFLLYHISLLFISIIVICITHILPGYFYDFLPLFCLKISFLVTFENIFYRNYIYQIVLIILLKALSIKHFLILF